MTDDRRRQRLFDQLWPSAEPPPDMAQRVLAALDRQRDQPPLPPPGRVTPANLAAQAQLRARVLSLAQAGRAAEARRRRRRPILIAAAASATVAMAAAAWTLLLTSAGQPPGQAQVTTQLQDSQGQQAASARTTVNIAQRAAAAMEPGADLTWAVRKQRVRVNQRRGSVFYRVNRGGPFQVSTPGGDIDVTGTCFRVTTLGAGPALAASSTLVSVLEGSVKVSAGVGHPPLAVQAGETVRLHNGQPPQPLPGSGGDDPAAHERQLREEVERRARDMEQLLAEQAGRSPAEAVLPMASPGTLVLPASTNLRVHGRSIGRVSLSIPPGLPGRGGARPIEVARDPGFRRRVHAGPVSGPFVTVPAPAVGHLYWRLAGRDDLLGHARFLPESAPSGPGRSHPHNLVSEGAERTSIYFQSAPPAVTLAFSPAPAAHRYRVRVYRADESGRPGRTIHDRLVSAPRAALPAGTLNEGDYLWTAQPLDSRGAALGGAPRLNKLQLAYDNALSGLAVIRIRPLANQASEVRRARAVDVRGVAPLGSRLFVNGQPARIDDKGRFAIKVGGRPRRLVFRLLGDGGQESYWVRRVGSGS